MASDSWQWTLFLFVPNSIAVLFVLKTIYFVAKNFFVFVLAEPLGLTQQFSKLGEWAVVTGATDGIGKGYAFDLARRGCNIVLISRTEKKLRTVAAEIETLYNVRTKILVADFTSVEEEVYPYLKRELSKLEVGTLVNNVGMMQKYPEHFHLIPEGDKACTDLIRCNMVAQTMMSRIILPQMVQRKKGVIINLSSAAGDTPVPLIALYSASKAYNNFLSLAMDMEYRDQGLIIQSIQPFVVATNMSGKPETNLLIIDSFKYARSCLNTVGYFTRTHGHYSHALQSWLLGTVPLMISTRMSMRFMGAARKEILRRMKEKGEWKWD
ncbi:hypothetical protein RvY_12868 [Ramazzottius varieornatus]|uniref:Uncharacterized protein n=1 Tax=Ramazzottius varieornatus TaxID=947166 RepID=A0A1D1VRC4_RAMVA|nr:hypothetical protein RvY_12868 [Ramazzottius varieornatus]